MRPLLGLLVLALASVVGRADDWKPLFNGKDLTGWRANNDPASFAVKDGLLRVQATGPTPTTSAHLFYVGDRTAKDGVEPFKNFELEVTAKSEPNSNGGIYFHTDMTTRNAQKHLLKGYEVQLNSTAKEKRKTGSLYAVVDKDTSPVDETKWFTVRVVVKDKRITVGIDGKEVVDYTEPPGVTRPKERAGRLLSPTGGGIALQAHDAKSVWYFKDIKVKRLPDGDDPAAREFPPATVLTGPPTDRGRAYGKAFRAAIRDFLATEIYAAFVGKPSSKDDLLKYAAACGKVVRAECPMVAAEAEGIADGAGLTFDEVVLICLHEELYHRTPLPKHGHCTAVAVGPAATGDGHAYVGQTWDWMPSVAGKSRVTTWKRTDAASVLAYGFPGMPFGAGVNSEGIALCWTSAALGDKKQSPRVGVPSYMLIAHLLAQKDLAAVAREAEKDKHAGWFTFVMADGQGNLLNLEGSPTGIAVERPTDKLARVDFGSKRMLGGGTLNARCRTMYDLLDGTKGKNDLARLKDYFAEPKYGINVGKGTIDQMVFDTTARKAYLSRGTSYKLAWRAFAFD